MREVGSLRGKVLLLMVALAASGLLAEGALRGYAHSASTPLAEALRADPYEVLVEPHGLAGYRPRQGRVIRYENGTAATINSMGFRGPTVPVPKPAGTLRVVLLGGSTSFGWGVDDDQTVDEHMRRQLADRHPTRETEVVSLAFDGYDSWQLYERLRSDGPQLEPDVIIINAGINDVRNAPFREIVDADPRTLLYRATLDQLRLENERGGPTLRTRAKHYLYSMRLPGWLRQQLMGPALPQSREPTEVALHWDALDYFERNLRRMIALGGELHAVVLLSTPPSSLATRYAPADRPIRDYWIHDARTTQIYRDSLSVRLQALVGVAPEMVAYVPHEEFAPDLFLDDAHLTAEGNARLAMDFVSALEPRLAAATPR